MTLKGLMKKAGAVLLSAAMLCTGVAVIPQVTDMGIEASAAGSSFDNAMRINVNTDYKDSISDYYDKDYYKFTLSNDSKVNIKFSHNFIDSSSSYWEAHIYNDDNENTELFNYWFQGNKKTQNSVNIGLPKGTYYIMIEKDSYSEIQYTFSLNATTTSSWEKEKNDVFETATRVYPNKAFYGSIGDYYDSDYYKFTLSSDSMVSLSFKHDYIDSGYNYWEVVLYKDDNENTEIMTTYWKGNLKNGTSCNVGLPKGTYYLRVKKDSFSDIDYCITVNAVAALNWEKELNNVFESATSVKVNSEFKGSINDYYDSDFYKFSIKEKTNVKIKFNHKYIDSGYSYWEVRLFKDDITNSELYSWYFNGNETTKTTDNIPLSSGTYYLRVDKSSFSDIDYAITIVDPKSMPIAPKLNKTSVSVGKGENYKLTANKSVSWSSSNSNIAAVSAGKVTAKNNGTATITAKDSNGKTASCKVTVKNAPSKITLTKGIVTIGVGEKFTLGSSVPNGSACSKRTYRTSNSSIVKMTRTDWQGDFVGVKPGVAYVTVRSYNGKESTCKVTVKKAPSKVTISKKALTLKVGQTATLSASIPSDSGCAARTFRTSNSSVVKMTKTNWTGSFKAMKKGTAYVTVRTYNGKESSCKVTVI